MKIKAAIKKILPTRIYAAGKYVWKRYVSRAQRRRHFLTTKVNKILADLAIEPVLVDVGASGFLPEIWEAIAARSCYLGFDPDARELKHITGGAYRQAVILNEAVTPRAGAGQTRFFLTRSPYCSSTLLPLRDSLANYLIADLFTVVGETQVPTVPLAKALEQLGRDRMDWLKLDTQGTDLQIFMGLPPSLRDDVLALDVEPGLIHAYQDEDLFVETHRQLIDQGFWLARLDLGAAVRIRQSTWKHLHQHEPSLNFGRLEKRLRKSPSWCEASYLRSLDWLESRQVSPHRYALLWAFAFLHEQVGFALDVALACEQQHGPDLGQMLKAATLDYLHRFYA